MTTSQRPVLRWLLASTGLTVTLAAACSHDWDAYDPRLGATGGGATGSGGAATTTGTGAASSSSAASSASSSSSSSSGGDAGPTYRDVVLGDGPIAYYRFEEASGPAIADETGNHPGTASGAGLTYGVSGAVGSAIAFDGSSGHVAVGAPPGFAGTAPYTFEAWIKPIERKNIFPRLVSKELLSPRRGFNMLAYLEDGGPVLGVERYPDDGGQVSTYFYNGLSSTAWSHVVGRFDGTELMLFVDGAFATASGGSGAPISATAAAFYIGWDGANGQGHFAGAMDEMAIYDKALADDRIAAHFAAGKGP